MSRTRFAGPIVLLVLLLSYAPAQRENAGERYLARAGNTFITEEEFLQRFELLPGLYRQRNQQLQQVKLELLISMVAEKLLAQEAQRRNLEQDSVYNTALLQVRKLLARDELYRIEVARKVAVSPDEISAGIRQALRQMLVEFLYFDREEDARFVRTQMIRPEDFTRLAIDSSLAYLRDTATVIWGDAEEAVERATYALQLGRISDVVKAGEGYYILKILSDAPNTFYTSMQPHVLRERVVSQIRSRKEHQRMLEVIPELLKGKQAYTRPLAFREFSDAVKQALQQQPGSSDSVVQFSRGAYELALRLLESSLHDTLTVAGTEVWTIDSMLDKLLVQGFKVAHADLQRLPRIINTELEFKAQQELIAQEALRRGLDRSPEVVKRLAVWESAYLADEMKIYVQKHITVSDAELLSYMRSKDTSIVVPRVRIRELRTSTIDEMNNALEELKGGKPFPSVVERWSSDPTLRASKGLSEYFRITERQPIGSIAAEMEVGQQYGPVRSENGFTFFELVGKSDEPKAEDSSFVIRQTEAEGELREMKRRRLVSLVTAQLGAEKGYEVFQDRLLKLKVSPVPMLVYRYLGFGDRIFEVPFVDPQLDWIEIDPPTETILP